VGRYNLNHFKKVIYICEIYKEQRFYYRQEFLLSGIRWGHPKPITERTFIKRRKAGFPVIYRFIDHLPPHIVRQVDDINALIDLALDTRDKAWFQQLVKKRKKLLGK
jgi:hypothetical protein